MCAVSSVGTVKCWGYNGYGALGQTKWGNGGDLNLYTKLGSGFVVEEIRCGEYHCCVLSTVGDLKCWGQNADGQLGYGDTKKRGDWGSGEMGNGLKAISLGSGFVVREFGCGDASTCAISTVGTMKCWGKNQYGQLGLGDKADRGDHSNEMGDFLDAVDVGSGFGSSPIHIADNRHKNTCIFGVSSGDLLVKCWGLNARGQLGYGDTTTRGTGAGQMGDHLDFVSFAEWPSSTVTSHWIAAGEPLGSFWNGIPNVECVADSSVQASQGTSYGTDIAVSCCKDGGSAMRRFGASDNSDCRQAKTFEEAVQMCTQYGYRLCTLREMLGRKTRGKGCSHDARYNWVSTPCGDGSDVSAHQVVQGRIHGGWGSAADSYCQLDSSNQAAYKSPKSSFRLHIGVGCCSMDGTTGSRPNCKRPATYQEAVDHCSSKGMRLCTAEETTNGKSNGEGITSGTGCSFDNIYQWTSTPCISTNADALSIVGGPNEMTGSGEGAASFDDFVPMILGAAAGVVAIAAIVALAVTMRKRKRKTASTEPVVEMKAVHVPDDSVATHTAKRTETEMEVVTGTEPVVGAVDFVE